MGLDTLLENQLCHWQKAPEVAHTLSFYTKGSKLSLFLLYRKWFLRYGVIFKIAIFGHETCHWPKLGCYVQART